MTIFLAQIWIDPLAIDWAQVRQFMLSPANTMEGLTHLSLQLTNPVEIGLKIWY